MLHTIQLLISEVKPSPIDLLQFYMHKYVLKGGFMDSREVIRRLKEDGWFQLNVEGSHYQFKHDTKKGKVTVEHPKKDFPKTTLNSIQKQSGVSMK
jgi:predicted RNA binding protein YcfA (HicA-like mRNA interferase family)